MATYTIIYLTATTKLYSRDENSIEKISLKKFQKTTKINASQNKKNPKIEPKNDDTTFDRLNTTTESIIILLKLRGLLFHIVPTHDTMNIRKSDSSARSFQKRDCYTSNTEIRKLECYA